MKKTLLLTAALACSGVAQAETWVCTSTHASSISNYGMPLVSQEYEQGKWVVDTNQGLLFGQEESEGLFGSKFDGTCQKVSEKFIRCDIESFSQDSASLSTLILDSVWATYSYLRITAQHTASADAQIGICTRTEANQ